MTQAAPPAGRAQRSGALPEFPGEKEFGSIFDAVDANGDGCISREELLEALRLADEHYNAGLGLTGDDLDRLVLSLGTGGCVGPVARPAFVAGMTELVESARGLGGLSLRQLQDVLLYAFEHFDTDSDGRISLTELSAALTALDLQLSPAALRRLHGFLDADGDGFIDSSIDMSACQADSQLDRWAAAFRVAMHAQFRKRGLDKLALMAEALQRDLQGAAHPLEWARRAFAGLVDFADQVVDAVEVAIDVAAISLALRGVCAELCGVESWSEVDLGNLTPFLLFLGMSGMRMAEEMQGSQVRNMREDEAVLYVKVFQRHGFSAEEFQRLVREGGAERKEVAAGESLDVLRAQRLLMVARGGVGVHKAAMPPSEHPLAELGPGATLGETAYLTGTSLWRPGELRTTEPTCFLSWDFERLREWMDQEPEASLRMRTLLTECMAKHRAAVHTIRLRAGSEEEEEVERNGKAAKEEEELKEEGEEQKSAAVSAPLLLSPGLGSMVEERLRVGDKQGARKVLGQAVHAQLEALWRHQGLGGKERTLFRQGAALAAVLGLGAGAPGPEEAAAVAELAAGAVEAPSAASLHTFFDLADADGDGRLSRGELLRAVQLAAEQQDFRLGSDLQVIQQLATLVETDDSGMVDRTAFVHSMRAITQGLTGLGKFSVAQLREILVYALDRFDIDGNGRIDFDEFKSALTLLQVEIASPAVEVLYRLLDVDGDGFICPSADLQTQGATSSLDRLASAFQAAMHVQYKRKGLDKVTDGLQSALDGVGSPLEKLQRSFGAMSGADEVDHFISTTMEVATFGAAFSGLVQEASGLESWSALDVNNVAPFLIFMGLSGVYMAREFLKQQVQDLSEDEALLYMQVFQQHGFPIAEFRQLLRQGGAKWEEARTERALEFGASKQRLGFVVRGRCHLYDASSPSSARSSRGGARPVITLPPGGTVGEAAFLQGTEGSSPRSGYRGLDEQVILEPGARIVWWDAERVRRLLALNEGLGLRWSGVLAEASATKLVAAQEQGAGARVLESPQEDAGARLSAAASAGLTRVRHGLASAAALQQQGWKEAARARFEATIEDLLALTPDAAAQDFLDMLGHLRRRSAASSQSAEGEAVPSKELVRNGWK